MTNQTLTDQQLTDIDGHLAAYRQHGPTGFACCSAHPVADAAPELLAEVRRLRTENERMRHELEVMYGGAFDNLPPAAVSAGRAPATTPTDLRNALDGLHTLIATSSRDWGTYRVDAWIWAVLCGWDCEEEHEHDELCEDGEAMEEMAARHGWDADTVAKARRYRAAVRAVTEGAAVLPATPGQTADRAVVLREAYEIAFAEGMRLNGLEATIGVGPYRGALGVAHLLRKAAEKAELRRLADEPPAEPAPPTNRADILAEAIRRIEDPEERAKTTTGLGLGWEAARDVLRRMADEQPTGPAPAAEGGEAA